MKINILILITLILLGCNKEEPENYEPKPINAVKSYFSPPSWMQGTWYQLPGAVWLPNVWKVTSNNILWNDEYISNTYQLEIKGIDEKGRPFYVIGQVDTTQGYYKFTYIKDKIILLHLSDSKNYTDNYLYSDVKQLN